MPSNFNYMNQSAPFWDFLASLEQEGSQHPLFSGNNPDGRGHERENGEGRQGPSPPFNPWEWSNQFFGGPRGIPHHGPPPRGPAPDHDDEATSEKNKDKEVVDGKDVGMSDEKDNGEGPAGPSGSDNEGCSRDRGRHGPCGGRRGRCGSDGPGGPRGFGNHHGPTHHGPGSHHGPPHGRRGPRGPWGRGGPFSGFGGPCSGMFDPSVVATHFWNQFKDNHPSNKRETDEGEDFSPDADIFDTESAFVVHISLPGAKKEDVGVNWDVEKSELVIAGVIYRPGNEEFLKTLAMNERKVGPFERKIRLGTRASPAHIDADGITAKLEDGILRIEVPKMDGGFVEIKKVDIE